jgi:transcriptional regulator with XRE-family HTH domain
MLVLFFMPKNKNRGDKLNHKYIKTVRKMRNLSLKDMGVYMATDPTIISQLEENTLNFSPLYQGKFSAALTKLNMTDTELRSIKAINIY